jgi:glutamine amidotransferase
VSRLFGYLGPPTALEHLLLGAPNAITIQARGASALQPGEICDNGFSFGWYAPGGGPCVFKSPLPIWLDDNLRGLARGLESDIWLGAAFAVGREEKYLLAPGAIHDDELLFLFEGWIPNFSHRIRPQLRDFLSAEAEADILGGGPREHLFALLQFLLAGDEELGVEEAIAQVFELCRDWLGREPADLSFLLSDGERLYAARLGANAEPPISYYTTDDEAFPEAQLLASEPLTDSDFWHPLPDNCVLILDPEQPPELMDLESAIG